MTMTQREPLEKLRAGCAEKKRLQTELGDLYRQRDELAARKAELERIKREEQEDVERLEGGSLAAFFYRVIGRQEEKMDQEQREAYAAAVKYDAAVRELAYVEQEIGRREGKLGALGDVEQRYARALEEKREALKRENGPVAEEILQLEDRNAWLMQQEREIREALQAGRGALNMADEAMGSLNSAEGWGTWDLLGGGLIADMAKHNHLDSAQAAVENLQIQLRRFRTELSDVKIQADIQVRIDGFLRFADFFFDGLFADWAVMDRIGRAQDEMARVRSEICGVLSGLEFAGQRVEKELAANRARLEELTLRG